MHEGIMDDFFENFFWIFILRAKNRFWWCLQTPYKDKQFLFKQRVSKDTMKGWRKPNRRQKIKDDASRRSTNTIKRNSNHLERLRKARYEKEEDKLYE